ncbi:MAG: dihydropteroate synthase [Flavobacteriales bacterium]|nr:dihydropteroate synthase [Flavobacteriales bacterium]
MEMNCNGKTLDLSTPAVMGILNLTPDSFYDGGTLNSVDEAVVRVADMVDAGAHIIDLGAQSSRPGAQRIEADEEIHRLAPFVGELMSRFPSMVFSIDTFHARVAKWAVDHGIGIVNDISGGHADPEMIKTVAAMKVPYVAMHMKGTPENMQVNPAYGDVVEEVALAIRQMVNRCHEAGIENVIIDPGFGFGKSLSHNYRLLMEMDQWSVPGCPILCGVSRKSMINKVLGTSPNDALNGTTVLHTLCLERGASILRVHDVREAVEAVKIVSFALSVHH